MASPSPRLRPLLLPVEHGGWGFLAEPIVIGLVAAPTGAGLWLALAALAAFLSRQPLKVALEDWQHGRRVVRTPYAWGIAVAYVVMAAAALWVAAGTASAAFWPLAPAVAPLGMVTLWFDARGQSRRFLPECAGAAALGSVAAAIARASGWSWTLSLVVWASALIRVLPAIVTVRERVRRLHGERPDAGGAAVAHLIALLCAAGLWSPSLAPRALPLVAVLLAGRAAWDLRPGAPPVRAMQIGVRELITGLVAAAAIGIGWRGEG